MYAQKPLTVAVVHENPVINRSRLSDASEQEWIAAGHSRDVRRNMDSIK